MDGQPFADTQSSLFVSSAVFNSVHYNEKGQSTTAGNFAMTGTNMDGTVATANNCANWTATALDGNVFYGQTEGGPHAWIQGGQGAGCGTIVAPLLCMGHARNVAVSPQVSSGRKVWVSDNLYPITVGQSFDAICQASKPASVSTAAALIAHPNVAASTLLSATLNYVRPDGTLLGTGATLMAGGQLLSGIWQAAAGAYIATYSAAWTGQSTLTLPGTLAGTCGDWMDPTQSTATVGGFLRNDGLWWNEGTIPCAGTAYAVYCVQTVP
jgi:hypothetical protein